MFLNSSHLVSAAVMARDFGACVCLLSDDCAFRWTTALHHVWPAELV